MRVPGAGITATSCSGPAATRRRPGPARHPGLELAGEVVTLGPGAERFAEGDRSWPRGGGGQAKLACARRARRHAGTQRARPGEAGGAARGVHHRPRRALHAGRPRPGERSRPRAAGGVGTAAVSWAGRPARGLRDRPQRRAPRGVEALGAEAIGPEGFGGARAVRRGTRARGRAQHRARPEGTRHGRPHRGHRRGRRLQGRGQPAGPDGQARTLRLAAPPPAARGEGPAPRAGGARRPAAVRVRRCEVPVVATFPLEEADAAYERFSAGASSARWFSVPSPTKEMA